MKRVMAVITLWSFALLFAATASAQQAPPTTHLEVVAFRTGSTTPAITPVRIPLTAMTCAQPITPPPVGTVVNPTRILVADPTNENQECRWQETGVGIFAMLGFDPVNTYFLRGWWVNANGLSQQSTDSGSFSRPGTVPSAPPAFLRPGRGQ